ncbi:MAG: hypothetical protein AAFN93_28540 [Bacteroidota bacterium]
MADYQTLIHNDVLIRMMDCSDLRTWEVFLGLIIKYDLRDSFIQASKELELIEYLKKIGINKDWNHNLKLFNKIINNEKFTLGEIL